MSQALLDAHASVHAFLEDALYQALAKLVHLDVAGAAVDVERFASALQEHMRWEDSEVLPVYRDVAPADGPGRADHVAGDHVILVRTLGSLKDTLSALPADATLREVLEILPAAYRVLSTLEHHTAREQQNVYPALARVLPPHSLDDVTDALRALVDRARTA